MEPKVATLCTFCAGLIPPTKAHAESRPHHASMGLIQISSQNCLMCKVLVDDWSLAMVQRRFPDMTKKDFKAIGLKIKLKDVQMVGSGLSWAILETNFDAWDLCFINLFSITACDAKSSIARQPIWTTSTTSIPGRISTAKSWLHSCELNHPKCKPLVSQLPKRLIDVSSLDGRPPRLVMSEDIHTSKMRYATLSYCWGSANFCTTRDNEEQHREEIPYQLLPQTLQDAVTLTRHLEIQYLWIDALCIVQDDYEEWEAEAARMQDVYSGSSITIAATDAADGSGGCFYSEYKPDPVLNKSNAFFATGSTENGSETIVRLQSRDVRTFSESSVLNARGWVLQEMVLSHRIVHMMRSGIYWECRSECRTESGIVFDQSIRLHGVIPILPHNPPIGANRIWWKWIESYSNRQFTFPKDRLPAIAGIVQHYQRATKDTPVLGLWERSLHQDLLWMRVVPIFEGETLPPPFWANMPSWTWLSCPYAVSYDFWRFSRDADEVDVDTQDHVTLIDWAVTWTSAPLTSSLQSTRLVLEGPIKEIVLSVAPKGKSHNPPYLDADDERPDFATRPFPWRYSGQFDDGLRIVPEKYTCLLLRSRTDRKRSEVSETFLILEQCADTDSYRRVGIGNFRGEGGCFDLNARRTFSLV